MSAIGKSVGDGSPVPSAQPVYAVDIDTGLPSSGVEAATVGDVDAVAYADDTGAASGTVISLLKGIYVQLAAINANTASPA